MSMVGTAGFGVKAVKGSSVPSLQSQATPGKANRQRK